MAEELHNNSVCYITKYRGFLGNESETNAFNTMKVEKSSKGLEVLVRTQEDDLEGFSFLEIMDRVDPLPLDFENYKNFKRRHLLYVYTRWHKDRFRVEICDK